MARRSYAPPGSFVSPNNESSHIRLAGDGVLETAFASKPAPAKDGAHVAMPLKKPAVQPLTASIVIIDSMKFS